MLKVVETICGLIWLIALLSSSAGLAQSPLALDGKNVLSGEELIRALREGGYALYFRHGVRDTSVREINGKIVMTDCGTQIPLSSVGRAQSLSIGVAMRKLGIPIGDVIASPLCRTMDTARLIAGHVRADHAVLGNDPEQAQGLQDFARLFRILGTPPDRGTNRLIVGHRFAYEAMGRGPTLLEGEAAIFRAVSGRAEWIARIRAEDWQSYAAPMLEVPASLRSSAPDELLELRALSLAVALRTGGYTIFFRHADGGILAPDGKPPIATDCEKPSILPDTAREQAAKIGEAIANLRLPTGVVHVSSVCPAIETARLIAHAGGGWTLDMATVEGKALEQLLSSPVSPYVIRIVVGDRRQFNAVAGPPDLEEGEAAVLRSSGAKGWVVVGRILAEEWRILRACMLRADCALPQ